MLENTFKNNSNQLLKSLEEKYNRKILRKIKYRNLIVIVEFISNYKPKSRIKKEENDILEYLTIINNKNLEKINKKELLILQKEFIYPFINRFMKYGFRYKYVWLIFLFFIVILDLIIFSFTEYFIPVFSVVYTINAIIKEIIASKENKLW